MVNGLEQKVAEVFAAFKSPVRDPVYGGMYAHAAGQLIKMDYKRSLILSDAPFISSSGLYGYSAGFFKKESKDNDDRDKENMNKPAIILGAYQANAVLTSEIIEDLVVAQSFTESRYHPNCDEIRLQIFDGSVAVTALDGKSLFYSRRSARTEIISETKEKKPKEKKPKDDQPAETRHKRGDGYVAATLPIGGGTVNVLRKLVEVNRTVMMVIGTERMLFQSGDWFFRVEMRDVFRFPEISSFGNVKQAQGYVLGSAVQETQKLYDRYIAAGAQQEYCPLAVYADGKIKVNGMPGMVSVTAMEGNPQKFGMYDSAGRVVLVMGMSQKEAVPEDQIIYMDTPRFLHVVRALIHTNKDVVKAYVVKHNDMPVYIFKGVGF